MMYVVQGSNVRTTCVFYLDLPVDDENHVKFNSSINIHKKPPTNRSYVQGKQIVGQIYMFSLAGFGDCQIITHAPSSNYPSCLRAELSCAARWLAKKYSQQHACVVCVLTTTYAKGGKALFIGSVSNLFSSGCSLQFKATLKSNGKNSKNLDKEERSAQTEW